MPGKHHHGTSEEVANALTAEIALKHLIGRSPSFLQQVHRMREVAGYDVPVLIRGESGTGKELFAEAIHHLSRRAGKPLLPENCGQISSELVANEFFGHVAGAYTGATTDSDGLIGRTPHKAPFCGFFRINKRSGSVPIGGSRLTFEFCRRPMRICRRWSMRGNSEMICIIASRLWSWCCRLCATGATIFRYSPSIFSESTRRSLNARPACTLVGHAGRYNRMA